MAGQYRDAIKDALYPKRRGVISVRNKFLQTAELSEFNADDVKKLRTSLSLSVRVFAELLGVSSKTVEAWEAGTNTPGGSARRLLAMMKKDPDFLLDYEILIDKTSLR